MITHRPFVYISSLMRTGSTRLPYSFIFREPGFGKNAFTPQLAADELNHEFQQQMALRQNTDCQPATYEQMCTQPQTLEEIRRFVHSPLVGNIAVGQFIGKHPGRQNESDLHGGQVTSKRVGRWRWEENQQLVAEAHQVFDLMPDYTAFWQYQR